MTPPGNAGSLPRLEQFDEPLDLLIDEVRRQKVSVEKVAIAPMVARFLEYVRTAPERNLNLDIEWLSMAATLIYWKSWSLLPRGASGQPEADPVRDDLVELLITHQKQAAQELGHHRSIEETRFSKGAECPVKPAADEPEDPPFVSVWDMIQQARELARWVQEQHEDQRLWRQTFSVEQDDVTVAEMIQFLRTRLTREHGDLDGVCLLQDQPTASRRSCLFLGMLEMARDQQLELEQKQHFGPIRMKWRSTDPGTILP